MNNNNETEDIEYLDIDLDDSESEFMVDSSNDNSEEIKKYNAERKRHIVKEIFTYTIIVAIAFGIAFILNKVIIINAHVPSSSMEPTINTGDKLIGFRLAYLFKEPERGDVVIFRYPDDESQIFIKRVIGLPGDKVEIADGKLIINGEVMVEDYVKEPMTGNFGPYEVPEGYYFMLGDNRNISQDSRYWKNTYVSRKSILAKAWFRYSPSFTKIQ